MLVGNPNEFAIESSITRAFQRLSFRALGYFAIHIGGQSFGQTAPDSTMLAIPLDHVGDVIARRGVHAAPFAQFADGVAIFEHVVGAIYSPEFRPNESFPSREQTNEIVHGNHLLWADLDEAFDDGSKIFQFDLGEHVRLIADKQFLRGNKERNSFRDLTIKSDVFYETLSLWQDKFVGEWERSPKILESEDGASG